jgi:hypothetical protein
MKVLPVLAIVPNSFVSLFPDDDNFIRVLGVKIWGKRVIIRYGTNTDSTISFPFSQALTVDMSENYLSINPF